MRRVVVAPLRVLSGVRVRLTLWYLAILAVVFVVFGAVVSGIVLHQDLIARDEALVAMSNQVAATYRVVDGAPQVAFPWNVDPPPAKGVLANGNPLVYSFDDVAVLVTEQGELATSLGPLAPLGLSQLVRYVMTVSSASPLAHDLTFALDVSVIDPKGASVTTPYVLYLSAITSQGHEVAKLVVGRPAASDTTLQSLVPGLLIAGPLTLLVAALGGYWLASRALRPVRVLTRTAREIGEGDLSRRLGLRRSDELGELAATFDGMLARLEAAFTRQRQFTADASHELRTPLTVVSLEVNRALTERRTPEEYERVLWVVQAESAYMSRLVGNLLLLARADAGQAALTVARLDLSGIALEVAERLASLATEQGVRLVVGELPEVPVQGDRDSLGQMVTNLVENAIKYTAGTGTYVHVEAGISADRHEPSTAWMRVSDDGPGIAPAHLPMLFDRFYREDAARRRSPMEDTASVPRDGTGAGGHGLGLAIARWVAQAHGGDILVHSTPGHGATFEVRLPLAC